MDRDAPPALLASLIHNDIPKWIRVAKQARIRIE